MIRSRLSPRLRLVFSLDFVLEGLKGAQVFVAHELTTRLEPVARKFQPLPRLSAVTNPRLVRMQRQAVLRHPRRNLAQRVSGPRLRSGTGPQVE